MVLPLVYKMDLLCFCLSSFSDDGKLCEGELAYNRTMEQFGWQILVEHASEKLKMNEFYENGYLFVSHKTCFCQNWQVIKPEKWVLWKDVCPSFS